MGTAAHLIACQDIKALVRHVIFSALRFPTKEKAGCTKAPHDFPPRKDGILNPPSGCHGTSLSLSQSLYGQVGHVR